MMQDDNPRYKPKRLQTLDQPDTSPQQLEDMYNMPSADPLDRDFGMPSAKRSGSDIQREKALQDLEDSYTKAAASESGSEKASKLQEAEENAAQASPAPYDSKEGQFFYRRDARGTGAVKRLITRRRALIGGSISSLVLFGGLGIVTISVPSLQAIHYSQILQGAFRSNTAASNTKLGRLYQYMRTGKVGTTRLTYLEYKVYPRMLKSFTATGVRITTERLNGQIREISLDPRKLSDMQGMSREQAVKYISDRYGVSQAKIVIGSEGGNIRLSTSEMTLKNRELFIKDIVRQSNSGKVNSALQKRIIRKYYNVPSMFHPFQRLDAYLDDKELALLRKSKTFRKLEEKRSEQIRNRTPEANARLEKIKSRLGPTAGVVGSVLIGTTVVCVAYDIASEAEALNNENFIDPSVRSGMDGVAAGEQIASDSPDVSNESIQAYNEGFYDPKTKTTPFDSQAIQALEGKNGGIPPPAALEAAFSPDSSATSLRTKLENDYKAASVCSTPGAIISGVTGVALTVLGPGGWIVKGLTTIGGAAASQGIITYIQSTVPQLIAEEPPIGIPHQGANGGAFDAYGVRKVSNDMHIAAAGSVTSPANFTLLENELIQDEKNNYTRLPLMQRLFDANDYRSLYGALIQKLNPKDFSAGSLIANIVSDPLAIARNASTIATTDVVAEQQPYKWSMPLMAPPTIINNSRYADPYDTADKAAAMLDGSAGQTYVEKALVCFGVRIAKSSGENGVQYWDVTQEKTVNTYSNDYIGANCGNTSDHNWNLVVSLVAYTPEMEALACRNGEESACQKISVSVSPLKSNPFTATQNSETWSKPANTNKPRLGLVYAWFAQKFVALEQDFYLLQKSMYKQLYRIAPRARSSAAKQSLSPPRKSLLFGAVKSEQTIISKRTKCSSEFIAGCL